MKEPIEFFLRFLKGLGPPRVILPDLGIGIQCVQRLQILGFKVAKHKAFGIQDDHEPQRLLL